MAHLIVIDWEHSIEYIAVDFSKLGESDRIPTTSEWWKKERSTITYRTKSTVQELDNGDVKLTLTYDSRENPDLNSEEIAWGTSIIYAKRNATDGKVEWFEENTNTRSKPSWKLTWKSLSKRLTKPEAKLERYTRLQRDQGPFRTALLALDRCCAISGESTHAALEAAHIIPSKNFGAEEVGNGILLRSDIHKLYDSGAFVIDESGRIEVRRELSDHYLGLLKEKQLPETTFDRVKEALDFQRRTEAEGVAKLAKRKRK